MPASGHWTGWPSRRLSPSSLFSGDLDWRQRVRFKGQLDVRLQDGADIPPVKYPVRHVDFMSILFICRIDSRSIEHPGLHGAGGHEVFDGHCVNAGVHVFIDHHQIHRRGTINRCVKR